MALLPAASADEPIRLTDDGKLKFAPAFADAGHIVFAVHDVPRQVVLMRLTLADGSQQREHPSVAAHQFDPAFSRDGRLHAYSMSSTSPQLVLVIRDAVSNTESVFRPREARATARGATVAPDGSRIAFSLSDVEGHRIASVDASGGDLRLLTEAGGANVAPCYSPDGRQIVFSSSREGDFDLYLMDSDGGNTRRLTDSPGMDTHPTWSPDGRRVAFTSNRDGNYEIYSLEIEGGMPRRLTQNAGKEDFPIWTPDGRRIVIVSEQAGRSDLWSIAAPDDPVTAH